MSPIQIPCSEAPSSDRAEVKITRAAIRGYGRLLRAVGGRIQLHASSDGGLICEDRTSRARPRIWRISPDGVVEPDRPYSFVGRSFVAAELPAAVH
jgi:hypothetical protein